LLQIQHGRGSAYLIALGASVRAFWGVFPTFGLSPVLSLFLFRFIRFNILVAISASFISNPLTSPFLLWISYKVGSYFVNPDLIFETENWLNFLPGIGYSVLIGSTLVSSATSLIIYILIRYAAEYRKSDSGHLPS
jgi:uncharacterized protein (DUF2062 family)